MDPSEKKELKDKLSAKGIGFDKAAEALKIPEHILNLYLKEDSNPVPKRIIEGLNNLLQ